MRNHRQVTTPRTRATVEKLRKCLPSESGENAHGNATARAQAEHWRLRSHRANCEQACSFGNLHLAKRLVQDDEVRHLAGSLDDRFEAGAGDKDAHSHAPKVLLTLLPRRGIGVGH